MQDNENPKTPNFKFSGSISNDEFVVDTPSSPRRGRQIADESSPEGNAAAIKKMLSSMGVGGSDIGDLFQELESALKASGFGIRMLDTDIMDSDDDDDEEEDITGNPIFDMGSIKTLLKPDSFWSVLCREDPEIHSKFVKKYGDKTLRLDDFGSDAKITCREQFNLSKVSTMKIVDFTDKYVLLFCESADNAEEGVYIAVIENADGEFELLVPEYGNSYRKDGEWFSINENPEAFTSAGYFRFGDIIDKVEAGLSALLVPVRNPLISPKKFGTLKPVLSNIGNDYDNKICIGKIVSNESAEAIMFKKDFDLPPDKTAFDFYLRFNGNIDSTVLIELAKFFNMIDFNNSVLFEQTELKAHDEDLYINIDLGLIPNKLPKWWPDEGNCE